MRFGFNLLASGLVVVLIAASPPAAWAQGADKASPRKDAAPKEAPKSPQPPAVAAPAVSPAEVPPMPDTAQLTLFIQIAMSALAQANMTGNYTVLHALGAPSFQAANSPARLADIFAGTRASVDLVPIILFQPILIVPPSISPQGALRLTGYYDTKPLNVLFDLLFLPVAGQWRLEGISVQTRPTAAPMLPAGAAAPTAPPGAPKTGAQPAKK